MFYLSPSRIARYFYHECERYLFYDAIPKPERAANHVPIPPFDVSPVTRAILDGGLAWEKEVITKKIAGACKIAPGNRGKGGRSQVFDYPSTIRELKKLKEGEYIYQPCLIPPDSFYLKYDIDPAQAQFRECFPDLIQLVRDEQTGSLCYRVIDVKASDELKISHKVQTAIYSIILEETAIAEGLPHTVDRETGGIWLFKRDAPETFHFHLILPHVEKLLAEDLPRVFGSDAEKVKWHLQYRCEWCEYFEPCKKEALEKGSVSLLPYLSSHAREYLRTPGVEINTLKEMRSLLKSGEAEEKLQDSIMLSRRISRLRDQVEALLEGKVIPYGGSSVVMPVGEHIRVLLTLQREPTSGRIYAYAISRKFNAKVFSESSDYEGQFVAARPEDCDKTRAKFIRALYGIFIRLHHYNEEHEEWADQKSIQTYLFDSYERNLLTQALIESLTDPDVAEMALALLFYFHSEDLIHADDHPGEETSFPVVVLTGVIQSLFAMPIPVAYRLNEVASFLKRPGKTNYLEKPNMFFTFELSNALKSDAIYLVWHKGKKENLERIEKELKKRLWATSEVVDGIREAARDPKGKQEILFAWPPKFKMPAGLDFNDTWLSKLAFMTRYESVIQYLETRTSRALPRHEREKAGIVYVLEALGDNRFRLLSQPDNLDLEPDDYSSRLLCDDTTAGEKAVMAYQDYSNRMWQSPKDRPFTFAKVESSDLDHHPPIVELKLHEKTTAPIIRKGRRYLLSPCFQDFNTSRINKRLKEIDECGEHGCLELLKNPAGLKKPKLSPELKKRLEKIANTSTFTDSQRDAFKKVVDNRLALIWGPPGTGKTHFLALAILSLLEAHRQAGLPFKVFISAFTHAAIENLLSKLDELQRHKQVLKEGLQIFKLGGVRGASIEGVEDFPRERCSECLDLQNRLVIGGTTYTMLNSYKRDDSQPFDLVVFDEGSQVKVADSLLVLSRVADTGRVIIAGDDQQLAPIIHGAYPDPEEGEPFLHRSIFEALRKRDPSNRITAILLENFRMNETLCEYPRTIYDPRYRSANKNIESRRLRIIPRRGPASNALVETIIAPDYPLTLCVLEGIQAGAENTVEAEVVARVAAELRRRMLNDGGKGFPKSEAGEHRFWREGLFIVSPHHAQINAIHDALGEWGISDLAFVDTVDKMQGQESEAVIVSYGVADAEYAMQEKEFIFSLNRFNVSITRARSKMIVFLPRPLLTPTLEAMENPATAGGIAYIVGLERHLSDGDIQTFDLPKKGGQMVVLRK